MKRIIFTLFAFIFFVSLADAEDFSSGSFIIRDSIIEPGGGRSISPGFELFSTLGQLSGESTSTSFISRFGWLYFPIASTPAVSATAGNSQVSLTWTASVGVLANITDYEVGIATVSGGAYTYQSVGDVLSYVKTGLTGGTTYYFRVRAIAGTQAVALSTEVSATPTGAQQQTPASSNSGSGGGGGGSMIPEASVIFSGRAYPMSKIAILKDGQLAITTIAGPDANFYVSLSGLSSGNYNFVLYSEDEKGLRSSFFTFPVSITSGVTTRISGIFIAPTIAVDKSEVKRGDNIAIFGQSAPQSEIIIAVNSEEEIFSKTSADNNGVYLYNFDTSPLETGQHLAKSKSVLAGEISSFSKTVGFAVGVKSVFTEAKKIFLKGDLNNDGRVNLIDFSITAYWNNRSISDSFNILENERLNGNGKIDLVDFSIMAFYWTG